MIELQNVTFRYNKDAQKAVLDNINLNIGEGEFVAVLGHNGSGKSTLAKMLNATLVPDSGRVLVDGFDTKDERYTLDIRKNVGMVFQNPDNQIVATIVEEDVAFGPENMGIEPSEIRRRVDEALKTVDMYDFRTHEPHNLSGGQKQRVAIAGVLAMESRAIVLDEPTAMLDPKGRSEVMETIKKLNSYGVTIVIITHNMDEAVRAKRIIVMEDGRISADGDPHSVFAEVELLKRAHLAVPQVTELAHELKKSGVDIKGGVLRTAEFVEAFKEALASN